MNKQHVGSLVLVVTRSKHTQMKLASRCLGPYRYRCTRVQHVQVFELIDDNWKQLGQQLRSEADYKRFSISSDGARLAITSTNYRDNVKTVQVQVYEHADMNAEWKQLGKVLQLFNRTLV